VKRFLPFADTTDTPCVKHSCKAYRVCASRLLACNAWVIYVDTGAAHDPRLFAIPDRATFIRSESESIDDEKKPRKQYKTMLVDSRDQWAKFFAREGIES
jgi:hypothetical protein